MTDGQQDLVIDAPWPTPCARGTEHGYIRLKGSTVLVTGGAGLIGSHIVDRLIDAGAGEIRVLDNLVRGRRDNLASAHGSPADQIL